MRVLICLLAFSLTACAVGRKDGSPQILTTPEANREDLQGAISSPLRDVNVLRTKIPPVLLQAASDPYAVPPPGCPSLQARVAELNDALGQDLDYVAPDPTMQEQGRRGALGFLSGAASDLIPFRSWVRRLSGAEQHDGVVREAITAGAVRRAYLKGLGEANGCSPPATPQHLPQPAPPIQDMDRPLYPIR